jgi:hypothetical protein
MKRTWSLILLVCGILVPGSASARFVIWNDDPDWAFYSAAFVGWIRITEVVPREAYAEGNVCVRAKVLSTVKGVKQGSSIDLLYLDQDIEVAQRAEKQRAGLIPADTIWLGPEGFSALRPGAEYFICLAELANGDFVFRGPPPITIENGRVKDRLWPGYQKVLGLPEKPTARSLVAAAIKQSVVTRLLAGTPELDPKRTRQLYPARETPAVVWTKLLAAVKTGGSADFWMRVDDRVQPAEKAELAEFMTRRLELGEIQSEVLAQAVFADAAIVVSRIKFAARPGDSGVMAIHLLRSGGSWRLVSLDGPLPTPASLGMRPEIFYVLDAWAKKQIDRYQPP